MGPSLTNGATDQRGSLLFVGNTSGLLHRLRSDELKQRRNGRDPGHDPLRNHKESERDRRLAR